MRLAHPFGNHRRRAALVFLGVLLTVAALGLSQCRMVDESTTGVSLDRMKPSKCIHDCGKVLADSLLAEGKLHADILRHCDGDSTCMALENARFQPILDRLYADYRDCVNTCHHQGSGGGGR